MIFTFYSYKGGVGRSMALANVAQYLYQLGFKVLMVDFDLESPGLHRFFQLNNDALTLPGVIDLLLDYKQKMVSDFSHITDKSELPFLKPHMCSLTISSDADAGKLSLLSAGFDISHDFTTFAKKVHQFDWHDFYERWNGEFYFSWLYEQLDENWDFILIDSRTGITEMGGVGTYQLADSIVMFCAPNQQNVDGIKRMAQNFTHEAVQEARERPLNVIITPSRVERAESSLLDEFQNEFKDTFWPFMANQAKGIYEENELWQLLNIPYVAKYAFRESLAMTEELGKLSATDMKAAYTNLTAVMLNLSLPQNHEKLLKFLQNQSPIPSFERTFLNSAIGKGFGYDFLDVICIIADNGSATVIRKIKATAFRVIPYLQTYLLITSEEDIDFESSQLQSLSSDRDVFLKNQEKEYGRITAQIMIEPPLNNGDSLIYSFEERFNSELFAIGKREEEISNRKSPDDFFNWNISNPTRQLNLEVHFPLHAKPDKFETEVGFSTTNELDRLADPQWVEEKESKAILRLTVEYPKVGLTYGIRWKPLPLDSLPSTQGLP